MTCKIADCFLYPIQQKENQMALCEIDLWFFFSGIWKNIWLVTCTIYLLFHEFFFQQMLNYLPWIRNFRTYFSFLPFLCSLCFRLDRISGICSFFFTEKSLELHYLKLATWGQSKRLTFGISFSNCGAVPFLRFATLAFGKFPRRYDIISRLTVLDFLFMK